MYMSVNCQRIWLIKSFIDEASRRAYQTMRDSLKNVLESNVEARKSDAVVCPQLSKAVFRPTSHRETCHEYLPPLLWDQYKKKFHPVENAKIRI